MSRSIAWRSKATPLILEMIDAAKEYKLYLINETGPFSFVFKDEHQNKFKVTIGATLKCSCGVVQNDHCIHTIFALLKRFKVDETNPIIWQASYVDSELEGFMSFKYTKKSKAPITVVRKNHPKKPVEEGEESEMSEIGDDQNCPICFLDMKEECFSTCQLCKNHLHTKCFKIWINHKQGNVTCPLCRNPFNHPMALIARDLERWKSRFTIHKGTKCQGCGLKNINGQIYHCLTCEDCNLCKNCFNGNQHSIHAGFLTKTMLKQSWRIAQPRNLKKSKKYLQLEKEVEYEEPNQEQMIQFLVQNVPTLKDFHLSENKPGSGLNIVGNQLKMRNICQCCGQLGSQQIRRLQCTHNIHDHCLEGMLGNKLFHCSCGQPFFPGYLSALGLKQKRINFQTEKTEKMQRPKQTARQVLRKPTFQESFFRVPSKPPLQKTKINHFRVRKNTTEKRPSQATEIVLQINNMPIRSRSLLRSGP